MKSLIHKILNEEVESRKEKLKMLVQQSGVEYASKMIGGVNKLIDLAYDGDLKNYFEENNLKPYRISSQPNLYISDIVVEKSDLKDAPFSRGREKELGKFSWVSGGITYSFTAYIRREEYDSGKVDWRVVGQSGDSGFGYSFISQRNTLGKRARMQIFKQIIEKYNLDSYLN
jgi:hypothetical protein